MGFFACMNFFALRVCLNVAIIVMVNSTYLQELEAATAAAAAANVSINSSSDLSDEHDQTSTTHDDDNVRNASK